MKRCRLWETPVKVGDEVMFEPSIVKQMLVLLEKRVEAQVGPNADLCTREGLAVIEREALLLGRELSRQCLEQMAQAQADQVDQHPHDCSECGTTMHRQGKKKDHAERDRADHGRAAV